jgi:hypothetical protein
LPASEKYVKQKESMIPNYDVETTRLVKSLYPAEFFDVEILPQPYKGSGDIKAIVVGADPSYEKGNGQFKVVFGLNDPNSPFFKSILENLKLIGLGLNTIYVQNLVKSYSKNETSKNSQWSKIALLWLENFKREIDSQFSREIPLLITAEIILKTIVFAEFRRSLKASKLYASNNIIQPEQNFYGRIIMPFYRHHDYKLNNWSEYARYLKRYFV